jgi:hypothetical protein
MSALPELALLAPALLYAGLVWRLGSQLGRVETVLEAPGPSCERDHGDGVEAMGISVVIAARNEEERLDSTLEALAVQTLPTRNWEVLVVDDGSDDATAGVARAALARLARRGVSGRLLATATGARGKKHALNKGEEEAVHPWVAVLDADSRPGPRWLESLAEHASAARGLLAGPVVFQAHSSFTRLAQLEYAGVLGAGLASFGLGRPLFASGANLCWRRAAFREAGGYQGVEHLPSADDTILLQRMARTRWGLAALLDPRAVVLSRAPENLSALWRQRARWAGAGRHMPDPAALAGAAVLWLLFALCLLAPLGAWAGWWHPVAGAAPPLLKLGADLRLVRRATHRLGVPWSWSGFALVWPGQLIYGLLAPWAALAGPPPWRGEAR